MTQQTIKQLTSEEIEEAINKSGTYRIGIRNNITKIFKTNFIYPLATLGNNGVIKINYPFYNLNVLPVVEDFREWCDRNNLTYKETNFDEENVQLLLKKARTLERIVHRLSLKLFEAESAEAQQR